MNFLRDFFFMQPYIYTLYNCAYYNLDWYFTGCDVRKNSLCMKAKVSASVFLCK